MDFCIVSKDDRYVEVNKCLCKLGYTSKICSPSNAGGDCVILSVRDELTPSEKATLFSRVGKNALVFCGKKESVAPYFNGNIVEYSSNEGFLYENACLTAEAAISYLHTLTKDTLRGKAVLVSGYGRIGCALCRLFSALGADVFTYVRREPVKKEAESNGYTCVGLDNLSIYDLIINTVPAVIYTAEMIENIPLSTYIVDLASKPYGFASLDRVNIASALPGKILPLGAAHVILDTIISCLSSLERDSQ